ncbi:MAG: hypothetical protein R3C45_07140 [Phycisphaerales bacterium]
MAGSMGNLCLYDTVGSATARFTDSFHAFKTQLTAFVQYLRSGEPPFNFEQTLELMRMVIGARMSREDGGRPVTLSEVGEPDALLSKTS